MKVYEERSYLCDVSHDATIDALILGLQAIQNRRKVGCVRHQPTVVSDVAMLPDPRCLRSVMKVINAAPIQEIPQDIDQGFILYIISNKRFLMASSQGPLSRDIVPDTEKRKGLIGKDQRISRSIE